MAQIKKQAKKSADARISEKKKELSKIFSRYNKAVHPLKKAIKAYVSAESAYQAKENGKNERRLTDAGLAVDGHLIKSSKVFGELMTTYREILAEYDCLIDTSSPRAARSVEKNKTKFTDRFSLMIDRVNAGLGDFVPRESSAPTRGATPVAAPVKAPANFLYESAEKAETNTAVHTVNTPVSVSSVSVAPVTIDITPMVERAINATVEKLSRDLDKKLAAYVDGINIPSPAVKPVAVETAAAPVTPVPVSVNSDGLSAVHTYSDANSELESHILEEQQHVFEKLKGLCESVQTLLEGIAEISSACMNTAAKQKEIAELQKQTNDTQRYTLREQQGIQVNQKVIATDQAELAGAQSMAADAQKNALEAQAAVEAALKSIADTQSAVTESQVALEAAMMEVVGSQKELLSAQQDIIKATQKNKEAQIAISEKQGEITAAQKEFLAESRQLLKDQKALAERQRTLSENAKEVAKQPKKRNVTPKSDNATDGVAEEKKNTEE